MSEEDKVFMVFEAAHRVLSRFNGAHADSPSLPNPWGLNPVSVEAIATVASAVITVIAILVALRTYLANSWAEERRQAALVTAYRTRTRSTQIIDSVEHHLIEIEITNSSKTNVFDLTLFLRSKYRSAPVTNPPIDWVFSILGGNYLGHTWGRWNLRDGGTIPRVLAL